MKTKLILALVQRAALLLVLSTLSLQPSTLFAQGTVFTYQGRLNDNGNPANGSYDLTFSVWNAASGPAQVGGILTNANTVVSNGLFTTSLDFGANIFTNTDRFLEIGVRSNGGGSFATLTPRQKLTPTPYAIFAENVGIGGLSAGAYGNAVTFNNSANSFSGSFNGNGATISNVNALTLGGVGSNGFWRTAGNAGTTPGANFLGTTDNLPLELKVNGQRALRLEPNTNGAPNVIGGSPKNFVGAGIVGATVAGGGVTNYFGGLAYTNRVTADFGTVGGGFGNTSSGYATVGGGRGNIASSDYATVSGGARNTSSGYGAMVGGGDLNIAGGMYATVSGGSFNSASGDYATVAGGANNSINLNGTGSFAAGQNCTVNHAGCFMWSDGTLPFGTGGDNRFMALASGGFYCYTGSGVGVQVAAGGNAWSAISDRNMKENFKPVDAKAVLERVVAMPVTTWNLKTQPPEIRHIGAMAQDFKAAFQVGEDDRHISTSDADGVALAAIQGLNQKLGEELKRLDAENMELKHELVELRRLISRVNGKSAER